MSIWLNWIERSTSNREVPSSSLGLDFNIIIFIILQ